MLGHSKKNKGGKMAKMDPKVLTKIWGKKKDITREPKKMHFLN